MLSSMNQLLRLVLMSDWITNDIASTDLLISISIALLLLTMMSFNLSLLILQWLRVLTIFNDLIIIAMV